ncbi:hypothetical protein ACFL5Q_07570, partial [Planctomycetota bacterium]
MIAVAAMMLAFASTGWADIPAPPVNQTIGTTDSLIGDLDQFDCVVCHDAGVPDTHHLLYGQSIPDPSSVLYPDADGDGNDDTTYGCLNCHISDFTAVERNCVVCHTSSPHHSTADAVNLHCDECHELVNDYGTGYIPSYSPSLVTPWRGLNGDGWENGVKDLISDGSGTVVPADVPLDTLLTRAQPNVLSYKPAGDHNDFVIGSTHHGHEVYSVIFTAGTPLAAEFDEPSQLLTVTIAPTQTALQLVTAINDATAAAGDVEASLGYDGVGEYDPEHYEPIGGDPLNSRGFGAGSCSYCHDRDALVDGNGDPASIILNNHDLHHGIAGPLGGYPARCWICHDYATTSEQSGANFNFAIRICENCHSPDTLHNIQVDSPKAPAGTIVVGGEDAGYGHVGKDGGAGDSDCWGCHGFSTAMAPNSGPLIPTVYNADVSTMKAGTDTMVVLTGSAFTNYAGGTLFESDVALTAADGSSVTLTPDLLDQGLIAVTIPASTAPGNRPLPARRPRRQAYRWS